MKILFWKEYNNKEAETIREKVDGAFIESAFKKVSKEIESLRKYDRGEKEIHAPNLKNIVRDLQSTSR